MELSNLDAGSLLCFQHLSPSHFSELDKYLIPLVFFIIINTFNFLISFSTKNSASHLLLGTGVFAFIIMLAIGGFFGTHPLGMQKLIDSVGIRKNQVELIVAKDTCNIIKFKNPKIITRENFGLCQTSKINVLFDFGQYCLIDPLKPDLLPFSLKCSGIKS